MGNGSAHAFIGQLERSGQRELVEHDGHVVCWRAFGAGAPLVLLHGGHGSWLHWARNIEALAASHRVLVPDMPGYGDSDALPAKAGFPGLVDVLANSLDKLVGTETVVDLAGFSFGGVVAGQLALQRKRVRKLALLGAVGHGMRRRQAAPMVNWQDAPDEQTMLAHLQANLRILMLHGPADPLALTIHRHSCLQARYHSKRVSLSPILSTALEELDMPVLLLWGEHDVTGVPEEVGPVWQAGRPERSVAIIRGAGHWVQYEAAGQVNQRLVDWFSPP